MNPGNSQVRVRSLLQLQGIHPGHPGFLPCYRTQRHLLWRPALFGYRRSFPKSPKEQNLRNHIFDFIEKRAFPLFSPPIRLFHVRTAVLRLFPGLMFDRIKLPAYMQGHSDLLVNPHPGGDSGNDSTQIGQKNQIHNVFIPYFIIISQYSNFFHDLSHKRFSAAESRTKTCAGYRQKLQSWVWGDRQSSMP